MKQVQSFLALISIVFLMSSCTKSGFPEINNLEVGLENSKKAYLGEEFHIDADIIADFLIQKIEIEIHEEKLDAGETNPAWEYSKIVIFTENLKNTKIHEDIDIPADVAAGEYHLRISVTDKEGNQTEKEEHFDLIRK